MSKRTFMIVGGGIAGITAAIALQQSGEDVKVYERFPEVRMAGAGITIAPNALKALEQLGLAKIIIDNGQVSRGGMAILNEKGAVLSELRELHYEYPMISIHRADLHRILLGALHPETVEMGKELQNVRYEQNKIVLSFMGQTTASGDFLIAADGIHSPVRKQLFDDAPLRYAGYTCWRGIADRWNSQQQPNRFTET
ncbi:FAD-dependent monooxygenase [Paenibacillus sp. Soil766]|uniref:FAD-dependent monooxygenase n=1 Tax=Paenibacillus sp. Soil766 TaxID=1736404 RepID=UPI000A917B9C|nr:FAD-dependent monooxygenase [Paenibacillus sp. Soil766]